MDAGTLNIRMIFGQDRRHIVPLFQRRYRWNRDEQWEPLWEDIRNVAEQILYDQEARPHFLGAIVLDYVPKPTGHVESRLVIDGQQRLTTAQILLDAFCDLCGALKADRYHRALEKLTRNEDPLSEDDTEKYKVWPTNVDQDHFVNIMESHSPGEVRKLYGKGPRVKSVGHAIGDAYLFFYETIGQWIEESDKDRMECLEALYNAVRDHLRLVVIDLGKEDDAQMIFETLNARGTPLSPSDLVKNTLFHQARVRGCSIEKLYDQHWVTFDNDVDYWQKVVGRGHARRARLDNFLHNFLSAKSHVDTPVSQLYSGFRSYVDTSNVDVEEVLKGLAESAKVFKSFDEFDSGSREGLFFYRLRTLDIISAFPFLLELFLHHGEAKEQTLSVLVDVESFLVRRTVCQLNTRGYNRFFIDLLSALDVDSNDLQESVRNQLLASTADSSRWPDDAEFRDAWRSIPAYKSLVRARVRMILEAVEDALRTAKSEPIAIDGQLTVEHLMPQHWQHHWPLPGKDNPAEEEIFREQLIHTFGNLTLLTSALNATVSNGPWDSKLEAFLKDSALALNRNLKDAVTWNEKAIEERGESLFDLACDVWPHPKAQEKEAN